MLASRAVRTSLVIPTHDRAGSLLATLEALRRAAGASSGCEILVVDDGSTPPVTLPAAWDGPPLTLLRTSGQERSAARNLGAAAATGELLVFLDDDMTPLPGFLEAHVSAQRSWPGALVAGAVDLPAELLATPFGAFRQALERGAVPSTGGPTAQRNLCSAQNASLPASLFRELGGFDPGIVSGEDQDLALRHTARGGRIVYAPDAVAVHRDSALDIRSYCRRVAWGSEKVLAFCRRHPDWPDNLERERINGPTRWGREPLGASLKKTAKALLSLRPVLAALFALTAGLERLWPNPAALDGAYRMLIGLHAFRGYRRGLGREAGPV
jgi:GT2 family glycosyltransferase